MGSLLYQINKEFESQLRIGESRHRAKIDEDTTKSPDGIFSYATLKTYTKQAYHFAKWVNKEHHCNLIKKARPYVAEYLQAGIDNGLSASTLNTRRAALCKLYHCTADDIGIKLPERKRGDIKRSRGAAARDYGFSLKKNAAIIDFCKGTGLRRHELAAVKPANILWEDGRLFLVDIKGKGGKVRSVEVLSLYESAVLSTASGKAPNERIFSRVPSHMDVHGYRREYAQALYDSMARPVGKIPKWDKYVCRGDKKGTVYDKVAMLYTSRQLGHNRISVIAGHYLN